MTTLCESVQTGEIRRRRNNVTYALQGGSRRGQNSGRQRGRHTSRGVHIITGDAMYMAKGRAGSLK